MAINANHARVGDTITAQDGTTVTVDQLPYLSATGTIEARVRLEDGALRQATWYQADKPPLLRSRPKGDSLWPDGDRPSCRHGDGQPVYLVGLCADCYARRCDREH